MMLQDFTIEHSDPQVIAQALRQAMAWGARVEGYFLCPTAPVVPCDEYPSHTLAHYRRRHPKFDRNQPVSGHIASVGTCQCLGQPPDHHRYESPEVLAAEVQEVLRAADYREFLQFAGRDGPFHGTDALIDIGYRLHYCSWHGRGLWLSFRHLYIGK
jgi:hypothetical protein